MKYMYVEWMKEFGKDKWEFVGRRVLEEKKGEWAEDNPDGISEDDGLPIYNFAYPVFRGHIEDAIILRVCEETSCTVVYNDHEGRYYLALTGCGMDLSQDIALAYMIVDDCIDWDMIDEVYISGPLSVSKENYLKLLRQLEKQLAAKAGHLKRLHKEVREKLIEFGESKPDGGDQDGV